ncbi:MAG TPA: ABC transporter permease [Mycobacteriales bacterium]|nr:ABC transporter permease [Mycobacteriales bacterium]
MRRDTAARRGPRPGCGLPLMLLLPAALAVAFLLLPLMALIVRTPWTTLPQLLLAEDARQALQLSLVCAASATLICLVLGVPLAWVLARTDFPGRRLLRALVTVPLVLPPVVGGVALLLLLGRRGLLGRYLDTGLGISLPFTTAAVVVAEAFVAMPFLVIAVEGALRGSDQRYDDAAATLGASKLMVFRRVTLPLIAPGVLAGSVLCFARALGEFGATITFAGSFPGRTQTMPTAIYTALESGDTDGALALSVLLLAVSVAVLISLRDRWLSGVPS